MSYTHTESESRYSRGSLINLEDHSKIMEMRGGRKIDSNPPLYRSEIKKMEYQSRLSTQGSGRRLLPASYFSIESLFLLICLTATLLILPLILPPLPPPPFLLLLLPIGILAVLMILAFMPTNARDITYTNVLFIAVDFASGIVNVRPTLQGMQDSAIKSNHIFHL